jgi:lipopolysaccharide/colanic/teichoic acid biosynthesis glycosyltransferase
MSRLVDVTVSATVLVMLAPLLLLIALANRVMTGRVLFRQVRVGRAMRPFVMLKFQSMVDVPPGASTITASGDRRITPLGHVLRTLKLDELPQLVNVLRGEMSLVGPRALTPNEVARVGDATAARVYSVRPGMTGLAQLVFSDEERVLAAAADPEEHYFGTILPRKMAIESVYVQRQSLWFDLAIMMLTPTAILLPALTRRAVVRWLSAHDGTIAAKEPA